MGKKTEKEKNQRTADGTFDGKQKKKEETKTKKRLPFQLGFCWKQKKKATTSLPANVCSFLVLTKMKKQKTFAFVCSLETKRKATNPFFFCLFFCCFQLFGFAQSGRKKTFPSPVANAFCLTSKNALLKGMLNFF